MIRRNIELLIGTRFYYQNHLYEVVEEEEDGFLCPHCAFTTEFLDAPMCRIHSCFELERRDSKRIFFKEVTETRKEL